MSRKTNVKKSVKKNQRGTLYESRAHERNLTGTQDAQVSAAAGVGVPRDALGRLAEDTVEAEDVIFALENPEWSSVGFTHDSNWYAHKIMGRAPQRAKELNEGNDREILEFYSQQFHEYLQTPEGQSFNWEDFPVQYFVSIGWLVAFTSRNPPIANLNVSKVRDLGHAFAHAANFNQPIGGWDTSNVKNMKTVFGGATSFDQNLGGWDISKVEDMENIFYDSGMSPKNLSLTFQGWAATAQRKGVHRNIDIGGLPDTVHDMDDEGRAALRYLCEEHGWKYRTAPRNLP